MDSGIFALGPNMHLFIFFTPDQNLTVIQVYSISFLRLLNMRKQFKEDMGQTITLEPLNSMRFRIAPDAGQTNGLPSLNRGTLQLKGHDFAAKKYIKFSDDTVDNDLLSDTEKIRKNKYLLYSDAGRLMQCAAFLRAFYDYAQRNDVQRIDWDIQFSKCFLLQEDGATPSIASAMKFAFGEDEGVTWLVEPRRSTSFEKFTGTLCHSRAYFGGLASETVHAFAHYVYIFTKHEVVVADLQGTLVSVDGKNLLMLFDPMTHTTSGLSGSGDFGEEGIKSFVRDHKCGPVCKAMKLDDEDESEVETPRDSGKAEEQGQGNRRHWATVL
ncbi:hypothetical protein D9757_011674 [Collybiopsis confluens]|uniref:Alpha-type protein kinase domain-containing protein n=1 Tax=Collybiopsis confluens TaxID=2823264 RepID=A0A8H5GII9_9AGAR|nr:hypothetical protein D9757_011674 [Collybiopsis confluens]